VAPRQAVAVLAGERAVEIEHEIGDLVGDRGHFFNLALALQVDQRADVHAADGAMAVVARRRVVPSENFPEARDEFRQLRRIDGGVFDEGDRLLVALDAEQKAETGLAHAPDRADFIRLQRLRRGVADVLRSAQRFELGDLVFHLFFALAGVLDDEQRAGIALDEAEPLRLHDVPAREVEHHAVGRFESVRPGVQNRIGGFQRLDVVVKVNDVERRPLRLGHEAHLRLDDARQRALGADDHAREIERLLFDEFVQIVSGDAAQNFGIAGEDFFAMARGQTLDFAASLSFDAVAGGFPRQLCRSEISQHGLAAVGQADRQFENVIEGLAVGERVRARGVVAYHAADRRAIRRRGVGSEEQTLGPDMRVQFVLDQPRLHATPQLLPVHFEDPVHVFGEIEDDGVADGLAGERRAAAAGEDGNVELIRDLDSRLYVSLMARDHDTDRLDLVHRRVGGIEEAGIFVEADFAVDALSQFNGNVPIIVHDGILSGTAFG